MGALIGANGTAPKALRAKTEAGTFPGLAPGAEEELSLSEESSPEPEESSAVSPPLSESEDAPLLSVSVAVLLEEGAADSTTA